MSDKLQVFTIIYNPPSLSSIRYPTTSRVYTETVKNISLKTTVGQPRQKNHRWILPDEISKKKSCDCTSTLSATFTNKSKEETLRLYFSF